MHPVALMINGLKRSKHAEQENLAVQQLVMATFLFATFQPNHSRRQS